jgi:secreted protein with Ig-like and vWFA domain
MSDSTTRTLKEELEIRMLALLTGELSDADADELEKILTVDGELADYRDRMAVLMGHIHDARDEISPTPHAMRLSDERRAMIFGGAEINGPQQLASSKPRHLQYRAMRIAAGLAVLFFASSVLLMDNIKIIEVLQPEAEFEAPPLEPVKPPPPPPPPPSTKRAQKSLPRPQPLAARNPQNMDVPPIEANHPAFRLGNSRGFGGDLGELSGVANPLPSKDMDRMNDPFGDGDLADSSDSEYAAASEAEDAFADKLSQHATLLKNEKGHTATPQPSRTRQIGKSHGNLIRQTPKHEKHTKEQTVSTFSLNVSDVSFKLAQAALYNSRIPDPEQIRSEEFLNSFDYRDPSPRTNEAVSLNWEIADLPYAHGRQVVRFSLQTQAAGRTRSQPLNLNLLIDNSGSMQRPDRRAIMEQSLQSLKDKLQPKDQLSVILFARQPKLIANANTPQSQQAAIDRALAYRPEGGTNLEAGLQAAYANARANYQPSASNRVILMTDGAANLGQVNAETLANQIVEQRKLGIALDAYGIGWDDYNDELLEAITRNGDGRYAFLNSPKQAAEDFSEKLAGALRVAAADVKVQITWNPQLVSKYRQIGYDLHQLTTEDFRDNTVDAAEIGEAESGTALYVIQINQSADTIDYLGTLQVRYRDPSTNKYHEQSWPLKMPRKLPTLDTASPALRLATASALFAERLAHKPYASTVSFDDLSELTHDLPEAFPTQQRVVDLQNMIREAGILLGDSQ